MSAVTKLITIEEYQKMQDEIAETMPDEKSRKAYELYIKGQVRELQEEKERLKNSGMDVDALAKKINKFVLQCDMNASAFAILQQTSGNRRMRELAEREIAKETFAQKALELAAIASPNPTKSETPKKWYEKIGDSTPDPRSQMIQQTTEKWDANLKDIPLGKRYIQCRKTLNHTKFDLKELRDTHDRKKLSERDSAQILARKLAESDELMMRDCSKKDAAEEHIFATERSFDWYLANVTSDKRAACENAVNEAKEALEIDHTSLKFTNLDADSRTHLVKLEAKRLTEEVKQKCPQY